MPHVHAHTGRTGQGFEIVKNCEIDATRAAHSSETNIVAGCGRKAVVMGKLLIFNSGACRRSQTP
jgi:hypothetical protein